MATVEELRARISEIEGRLEEIDKEHREGGLEELPEPERAEWNDLAEERVGIEKLVQESEARQRVIGEFAGKEANREAGFNVAPSATRGDDIWDLSTVRMSVN